MQRSVTNMSSGPRMKRGRAARAAARACVKALVKGGSFPSAGSVMSDVRRSMIRLGSQFALYMPAPRPPLFTSVRSAA